MITQFVYRTIDEKAAAYFSKCFQCAWNQAKSRKLDYFMWSRNHQNNVFLQFNGMFEPIQTISSCTKCQDVIGGFIDKIAEKRRPNQRRHYGHNIYQKNGWIEIRLKRNNDWIASIRFEKERRKMKDNWNVFEFYMFHDVHSQSQAQDVDR